MYIPIHISFWFIPFCHSGYWYRRYAFYLNFQVIQFECGDTQAGTTGCLQYFTGPTGTIASFNFPMGLTTIGSTGTVQC